MKRTAIIAMAITCMIAVTGLSSCKDDDDKYTPDAGQKTDIQLANDAKFGKILTGNGGRTLYAFALDVKGQSACTSEGCALKWPLFYKENPSVGTGLDAKDFGVITRSDNKKQTTYKGWPLYYFADDTAAGNVKGDGAQNTWFVAKPDYAIMIANAQLIGANGISYTSKYEPGTEITPYFTDARGATLYLFTKDTKGINNFTKGVDNDKVWPIYLPGPGELTIPSILKAEDFGQTTILNMKQLTYKGWPVYYYGSDDKVRGITKGVSEPVTPGTWPILNTLTTPAP